MELLDEEGEAQFSEYVVGRLERLHRPVKLVTFTSDRECRYCEHARRLVKVLATLSELITFEVHDLATGEQKATAYGIDAVPAVAVVNDGPDSRDDGVRFFRHSNLSRLP